MARFIEVQITPDGPRSLTVGSGDILQFAASGGYARSGPVQIMGPYRSAVVGDNGEIITPVGAPNIVLVWCRGPGHGTVEVVTGDPWHDPKTITIEINVRR